MKVCLVTINDENRDAFLGLSTREDQLFVHPMTIL